MGDKEGEVPRNSKEVYPKNTSPEMREVIDKTEELLRRQAKIKRENDENSVAFRFEEARGTAQLLIFPKEGDRALVRYFVKKGGSGGTIHLFESNGTKCVYWPEDKNVNFVNFDEDEAIPSILTIESEKITITSYPSLIRK